MKPLLWLLLGWALLTVAVACWAYPVIERHPDKTGYIRIINYDEIPWWCWANTGRGYIEKVLYPGQSTLWRLHIYEWGCEPA